MARYTVTNITKDGSDILFTIEGKENPIKVKFDGNENFSVTSFTGQTVKRLPPITVVNDDPDLQNVFTEAASIIDGAVKASYGYLNKFRLLERFLATPDVIDPYSSVLMLPDYCPKGYVKWLRENSLKATNGSYARYIDYLSESKMDKDDRVIFELVKKVRDNYASSYNMQYSTWYSSGTEEMRKKFNQMVRVTAKELPFSLGQEIWQWVRTFITDQAKNTLGENWWQWFDVNRSLKYNIDAFKELLERERNSRILKNEARIKKIESLSNEKYTIIVPSTMEDFTEEGKKQNNCVGYYYHDTMAEGVNLIYFIRLTSNPTKPYITNRYYVPQNKTKETRMANNRTNEDEETLKLISSIDEMITELLAS